LLKARIARWALPLLVAAFCLLFATSTDDSAAQAPGPSVDQQIVATWFGGEVELTGSGFGLPDSSSHVRFDYGSRQKQLASTAKEVQEWTDTRIAFVLPTEVQSGTLTVVTADAVSEPVPLSVYLYEPVQIAPTAGTNKHELTVAVAANGWVWFNQEYHLEIKGLSPDAVPEYVAVPIPQAPGPGIFAATLFGDNRSRISASGEDIAVGADGKVWLTQGGANFYPDEGLHYNTSRIIAFDPSTQLFECYNVPVDNAQVVGIVIDDARGMIWYAEAGGEGNAISGFVPDPTLSDCEFDPYVGGARAPICTSVLAKGCHSRFEIPRVRAYPAHLAIDTNGDLWFTEAFGTAVGVLDPEGGSFSEVPLPASRFPSFVGSFPWELDFDATGDLWVTEYGDATVLRIMPSLMATEDCLALAADGTNPCVEEVFVADFGTTSTVHSLDAASDGKVWFGVELSLTDGVPAYALAGFIAANGDAVTLMPAAEKLGSLGGIQQDSISGDVWFAQFWDHKIGRLRPIGSGDVDGDGVADLSDNCVVQINVSQQDSNADGLGDACDPNDLDHDGCDNLKELGTDPAVGGMRDPELYWDFFDLPNAAGFRDRAITSSDFFAITRRIFTGDSQGSAEVNRWTDPLSAVPANGYHPAFDRSRAPGSLWRTTAANGAIDTRDLFSILGQFGHRC
jgi:streptogramin lyase